MMRSRPIDDFSTSDRSSSPPEMMRYLIALVIASCAQVVLLSARMIAWHYGYEEPFAIRHYLNVVLFCGPAFVALLLGARLVLRGASDRTLLAKVMVLCVMLVLAAISLAVGAGVMSVMWGK